MFVVHFYLNLNVLLFLGVNNYRAKHNVEINGVEMLKTPSAKDIAVQIAHLVETDPKPPDGSLQRS